MRAKRKRARRVSHKHRRAQVTQRRIQSSISHQESARARLAAVGEEIALYLVLHGHEPTEENAARHASPWLEAKAHRIIQEVLHYGKS
jgi:hypothetical protein